MISRLHGMQIRLSTAQAAALLALAMLPAVDAAAQDNAAQREMERSLRELELERDQARAQREMDQRERIQREALRDQERIIQRQDDRLEQMRRRLDEASRDYALAAGELGRSFSIGQSFSGDLPGNVVGGRPRALLGISVDTSERRDGALVSTVSPGGAAEEAGLRAGDLITAIDGFDLTKEMNPGRALVEKLQAMQPDTRVKLGVLRDGRKMNYEVALRPAPPPPALPPVDDVLRRRIEERAAVPQSFSTPLGGMEFATVSDRLGNYFGVKEGVLVVRAGADSPYGLQDGDVILSIDGRKPANAQHVGRILRSYQPGEKVKLRVQRDRKAIDLESVAPGARGAGGR
ncbi:MAG: PDZ domain-containing protein [Pseudomonadota bacterium]|nr:PDZ domain-containing protein [Pseudomonadota bacterium]